MAIEFDMNTGIIRNLNADASETTNTMETSADIAYTAPAPELQLACIEIEATITETPVAIRQAAFKYFFK